MTLSPAIPCKTEVIRGAVPAGVRWLLLCLTLFLAALLAFQIVYLTPRTAWVMQHLGAKEPGYLRMMLRIPEWAAATAALALGLVALWQRGSVGRSVLLAMLAVAANAGCLLCMVDGLFHVLSRVPSP